jgi:hypothetical protein
MGSKVELALVVFFWRTSFTYAVVKVPEYICKGNQTKNREQPSHHLPERLDRSYSRYMRTWSVHGVNLCARCEERQKGYPVF